MACNCHLLIIGQYMRMFALRGMRRVTCAEIDAANNITTLMGERHFEQINSSASTLTGLILEKQNICM